MSSVFKFLLLAAGLFFAAVTHASARENNAKAFDFASQESFDCTEKVFPKNDQDRAGDKELHFRCPPTAEISWRGANTVSVDYQQPRLSLTQRHRVGADVISAQTHIHAGTLTATESWRSEVDAALHLLDTPDSRLTLKVGFFDTQSPIVVTRGGFGVRDFDRWRTNAVADAAVIYSAYKDRLVFGAGVAAAETGFRFSRHDAPWMWVYEPNQLNLNYTKRDEAAWLSLTGKPVVRDDLKLSFALSYMNTGLDFRSFQTNTDTDFLYEGETFNFSSDVEIGATSFRFARRTHADAYYAFDKNFARLERGAVSLKLNQSRAKTSDGRLTIAHDETVGARLALDLGKIFKEGETFLPDSINVGVSRRRAIEAGLFSSAGAVRSAFGVGMEKAGEHYSTDIYVYWKERDEFTSAPGPFATTEFGADVVHSVFFDDWSLSVYALMSDLTQRRQFAIDGRDRTLSGGIAFAKSFKELPPIDLSLDLFQAEARSLFDEYAFRTHDVSIRAETNISGLVFAGRRTSALRDEASPLSLFLGVYSGWSLSEDDVFGRLNENEARLLLMLKKKR